MRHQAGQGPHALAKARIVPKVSGGRDEEARPQSCMTRAPATYQACARRSVAPFCSWMGAAGLDQQDHPLPSIQERHPLPTEKDSQVRTCRITGAGEVRHEDLASAAEDYLDHLGPSSEDIAYEQWHPSSIATAHTVVPLPFPPIYYALASRSIREQDLLYVTAAWAHIATRPGLLWSSGHV